MKMTTRFSHANGSELRVLARTGKTGIHVFASVRKPGERAFSGSKTTFEVSKTAEAQVQFDKLIAEAKGKGWTPKSSSVGAASFTEIPSPDALPVSKAAPAPKPEAAPRLVKKGGKR